MEFNAKADAAEILASVQRRGIRAIYHFTHIRNLPSIFTHGILSRSEMDARGIAYVRPPTTWGSSSKANEFKDYICCGITRPWRMMQNEEGPLAVIKDSGACEHFDALFASSTDGLPSPTHADVLVYKVILQGEFYRVYFADDEANEAARSICAHLPLGEGRHIWEIIPFATKPSIFPTFKQE